jgi:uncharacterized membrane protein
MIWNDQRLDKVVSVVLRAGVTLAAALVLIGGVAFLATNRQPVQDHRTFQGAPAQLRSIGGVVHGAVTMDPLYIIQLGLLILIATPVVRVATCAAGFAFERDWMYAIVSLIVLAFLLASFVASGV